MSCIEEVIPWAFAYTYDRQNYVRYLIPFLDDMRHLPVRMPEVYTAFNKGHFSVQMSETLCLLRDNHYIIKRQCIRMVRNSN